MRKCANIYLWAMGRAVVEGYGLVLATWGSSACPELTNTHGYSWFFVFTRKRAAAACYRTCDFGVRSTTHSHRGGSLEGRQLCYMLRSQRSVTNLRMIWPFYKMRTGRLFGGILI